MSRSVPLLSLLSLFATLIATGAAAAPVKTVGLDDMTCRAWVNSKDDAEQREQWKVTLTAIASRSPLVSSAMPLCA